MGSIGNTVTKGCACVRGMSALGLTWSGGAGAGEEGGGRRSQRFGESFGGTLVGIHEGWGAGEVTIWVRRGGGLEEVEEAWIGTLRELASCCWCSGGHGRSAKDVEEASLLVFGLGEITRRGERGGEKRWRLYVFHS